MGYGGALIWSSVARNIKAQFPEKHIVFLYKKPIKDIILFKTLGEHVIFENNDDISLITDKFSWKFLKKKFYAEELVIVDMDNPACRCWERDEKDRIVYKEGKHAVEIACDGLGIKNQTLRPKLRLTEEEEKNAEKALRDIGISKKKFICIEPDAKIDYTPNKLWPRKRWQSLVDQLRGYFSREKLDIAILQVGAPESEPLKGVLNAAGLTSFRESAAILRPSLVFVGTMGGLVHVAKSLGKRSVVLVSAFEPKELAAYPDDINFYTEISCKNCGLRTPCPIGIECMEKISVDEVFDAVLSVSEDK